MADIVQSINVHNQSESSHPYLQELIRHKANENHTHLPSDIINLELELKRIITKDLIDDKNYLDNVENELAKLKIPSQMLLYEQLKEVQQSLAEKKHTHTKEEITDFAHTHEDLYYTKEQLGSLVKGAEGARLIGAILDDFSGTNLQDLIVELRNYVDEKQHNFFVKDAVRVVATQNIKELSGIRHTIDGVSNFKAGDRVLLAGQIDNRQNGIYIISSGAWFRSEDMNEDADLAENIIVFVEEGLENIHTGWRLVVKYNTIAQNQMPLQIDKCAIFAYPFSYNRNLKDSETIYIEVDGKSNVLSPNLKPILANYPTDTVMGRVFVDQYGRVIGGDILGPNGKDFHLEDYNIVGVMTEEEVKDWVEQELGKLENNMGEELKKLVDELKQYTDDAIKAHENNPNTHKPLMDALYQKVLNSTDHFAHRHDDLYFTEAELQSSELNSGAKKIGVADIEGLTVPSGSKNVQAYLEALKRYTDGVAQSLDIKDSVFVTTTANITLSGLQEIDGIPITEGKRVLVKDQTDKRQNGIYEAKTGAWVRAKDADTNEKVTPGLFTFVEEGVKNQDTGWVLASDTPISLDVSQIEFVQFSRAGTVYAGPGLVMNGNEISMPLLRDKNENFTKITTDVYGKIIGGENPDTLAGMGITDAYTKKEADDLLAKKAGLETANETRNGLMSKEDFIKLKGIADGAEVNQNAYSHAAVGSAKTSAKNKTDTLIFEAGKGIAISILEEKLKFEIGKHEHTVKDITDFPEKLPADGGNADTLDNHPIEDFVLHATGQGAGDVDTDLPASVNSGISKHDADPTAHNAIQEKFKTKADLVEGLVPISQLPAFFNIDPVRTAIVGKNGNWWYWDVDKKTFVDSGVPAKGKDGTPPVIGEDGFWYVDGVNTQKPSRGEKGEKGDPGKDGVNGEAGTDGKSAFEGAQENGYTGTEEEFYDELSKVKDKANTQLDNILNEDFYNKGIAAGLGNMDIETIRYFCAGNEILAETIEVLNGILQNRTYDKEETKKRFNGISKVGWSGSFNDLIDIPIPEKITTKMVTLSLEDWSLVNGFYQQVIEDSRIRTSTLVNFSILPEDANKVLEDVYSINENSVLFAKTREKPTDVIHLQLTFVPTNSSERIIMGSPILGILKNDRLYTITVKPEQWVLNPTTKIYRVKLENLPLTSSVQIDLTCLPEYYEKIPSPITAINYNGTEAFLETTAPPKEAIQLNLVLKKN